jgi:PAS domain S-box-containing protein
MVPLALVSILATLSLMDANQRTTLLIVTCCMLGVVPVLLFQAYRKDISQRDQNEGALRESEERYRQFLSLTPTPIALCSRGRILEGNPAWEQLIGATSAKDYAGRRLGDYLDLANRDLVEKHLHAAESLGKEKAIVQHAMVRPDGKRIPVEILVYPTRHGSEPALQLFVNDLSSQKSAEQAMELARREAESAAATKNEFLANLSHQIRTPMNAIIGFSGLMLDTRLDANQQTLMQTIRVSADHLLGMFNDVLDLAKLEAGQLLLEPARFDLERALEELLEWMEPKARGKQLSVSLIYGPDVPRRVIGDPGRIRQVAAHLIHNAIRYTDKGRVLIAVEEERRTEEATLIRVSVSDTGSGIPNEQQRTLFQAFTPGPGSKRSRDSGLGIGLSVVKRLVELMSGTVGMVSKPGLGSTFHFRIPLTLDPEQAALPASGHEPGASMALHREDGSLFVGRRILLVDDNPTNQQLGVALLERFGARVDVAANGAEAVQLADRLPYDAIFMDCQMPEMDGYDATVEIRRREMGQRRTPIVAMTANGVDSDKARCMDAGMDDYIGKPVNIDDLRALLAALSVR